MHMRDASGKLLTGGTIPKGEELCVALAERNVAFDNAVALMQLQGDHRVDDLLSPTNAMEIC